MALVAYQDHPDFAMFRDACIAGYRSVRAISDADLALLPMFLLIRDMAQMGWFHQRPEIDRAARFEEVKAIVLAEPVAVVWTSPLTGPFLPSEAG